MPDYKVECYGCAEEHSGSLQTIGDIVTNCEYCGSDICEKCKSTKNPLRCEQCEDEE